MKKILTTGILTSCRPKVDGSWSVTVNTVIPSKEQRDNILDLMQQEVVIYLREGSEVTKEEIEVIDEVDIELGNGKTPSIRLRSVLFVLWKQEPQGFTEFKEYYQFMMNKIIEHYKTKLK